MFFCHFVQREITLVPVGLAGWRSPSEKGSTLEGKNLLLWEQILFFKS